MAKKPTPRLTVPPPGSARHFAAGGLLSVPGGGASILGVSPIDGLIDVERENAEKTARWAAEDLTKRAKYSPGIVLPVASSPQDNSMPLLDNPFTKPQETTFQQDSDARQSRITAYANRLKTMEANGRANSLMGSSMELGRAFADGGIIKETPEQLMARMAAKYGTTGAAEAAPAPQQPAPKLQAQQRPEAQGLSQGIIGIMKGRQQQIDKAAGYSRGGIIRGPGTSKSDSIPATVRETGEGIRVSTQERILSKMQDEYLEEVARAAGFDSLNAWLEAGTGVKVGPTVVAGKRAAATGFAPEDQARPEAFGIDDRASAAIAAPPTLGGTIARSEPVGGALSRAAQAAGYRPEINGITWQDKSFDPTKQEMAPGTGAIAIKSGQNAGKNIAIGPQQYTAADGTPTSDWSKTAQYAQGVAQAQKDRYTLATMQRDRLERDAYSPDITDPQVIINARQQLHDIDAKAAKQGEAYGRLLDNQGKLVKLQGDGQMQGLQAQYLAETDPARREALAERIRGVSGKGTAPAPVNLQHVETDLGVMAFDPRTGRMAPVVGQDGAPVGSGKALTEFQGKSTSFGMRADVASKVIDQVGQGGKVQPSLLKRAAEAVPLVGEGLGMAANQFQSPEQQQVEQAQRDFVNAVLRQESGAAISASEFDNARKQYFPQPGDSAEVVAQKQRNRESAINGFRISAGPGAKNIGGAPAQQQARPQQPAAAPKVGTVDGKHIYIGGNPADPASWVEVR